MLKQGDVIRFKAENYADAETVGVVQDTAVFVPRLIVGEEATVKINYVKKNAAYGDVVQITKPSAKRRKPPCPRFGECGGCALLHMAYSEQLVFKRDKVCRNLRKIGKLDAEVLPCVPSALILGYRNKLSLPVSGKRGNAVIGMYRRNSHEVISCERCLLGGEWAATLAKIFKDYLDSEEIAPYNEKDFSGEVRHLVARYIDGQLLAVVVSNGEFKRDLSPFARSLERHFDKFGLFVNVNDNKNNVIMGKFTTHICGLQYIESEHLGVKFRLRPNSFFQVNNGVKDAIYLKVKELLDLSQTEALIDCFSGIGVLTNVLADGKFQTYAIEIEPSAISDAKELAELNGKKIFNICGDVNKELPKLVEKLTNKKLTLTVDPPRKGLGDTVCQTILQANIDNIVYISCDSATLARDLSMLSSAYDAVYVEPYDMFPQTDQVETVVLLARKKNSYA
ncbi:MAG: 23S rRNA (uracil(1939)-C(5))-methyltransferase RlmD [Firmicutes bacterium]|nr:23S rRNA (uracil(1939)-C(5))-methyltransferase RlmD [Bacillota bacterium]